MSQEPDLVIVGGLPAGLATAIRAAQVGLAATPVDKACGEGLMPDGVALLERLSVEVEADGRHPFHGVRNLDSGFVAEGRFRASSGLGVRRVALHRALVRRTEALGVDLRWGVQATALAAGGVETEQGLLRGRFTVVADGLKLRLRRAAGLAGPPGRRERFGVRRHFALTPWSDLVEVYWGEGCEAYVTPVSPRRVGVALNWSGGYGSFNALLPRLPLLAERLAGAEVDSRDRGAGPFEQRTRGVVSGSVALALAALRLSWRLAIGGRGTR